MEHFDLKSIPQEQLVAFYGLLFSAGIADSILEKEELQTIYEFIDLDILAAKNKDTVRNFVLNPPEPEECLRTIAEGKDELRFAVLVGVVEVVLADEIIVTQEHQFLDTVCLELNIAGNQLDAVIFFIEESKRIIHEEMDDETAGNALLKVALALKEAGIPISAVYFSGTIISLSAAGITNGLVALGLEPELVMGVGVAPLIGAGIFDKLKAALGDSKKKKEKERKSKIVIRNLQEAITKIINKIEELESTAMDTDENDKAIIQLKERLLKLKKVVSKKTGKAHI
ncbi:MAG: hypothetical protein HW421_320 [Ignavibacteria bacterium]|nr:hypothetical protein [Ignavibacteria bacterium]